MCLCGQIDDYSMVRFMPFDRTDEEGINIVLQHIDFSIQYGEDLELKEPKVLKQVKTFFNQFLLMWRLCCYFRGNFCNPTPLRLFYFYFLQEVNEEGSDLNFEEIFQGKLDSWK